MIYFDTSYILKCYLNEKGSAADATYPNAGNVTDDAVGEQIGFGYDAASNLIRTTTRLRFHEQLEPALPES